MNSNDNERMLEQPAAKPQVPELAEIEEFVEGMLYYNFERLQAFLDDEKH